MEDASKVQPDFKQAEAIYPQVLKQLQDYELLVDFKGDEDLQFYKQMQETLEELTNKDLSNYNLYEAWEQEGIEVLAFGVALPCAVENKDLSKKELVDVLLKLENLPVSYIPWDQRSFKEKFEIYTQDFYHEFLKQNYPKYNFQKLFGKQKDQTWLTPEQIADKLM